MLSVGLAGGRLCGGVAVRLAVACGVCGGVFLCCPFSRGVSDGILNLIESVSEGFPSYPYVVISIPNKDIPVFKVRKESDEYVIKIFYRNMLLPFVAIPGGVSKLTDSSLKVEQTRPTTRSEKTEKQLLVQSSESEDNLESHQDDRLT